MRAFIWSLAAICVLITALFYTQTDAQTVACITTSSGDDTLVYDVKIVFTGLMTFVPGTNAASVIIPDVKDGHKDIGDDKHSVHEHVPYILARTDAMCRALPINVKHRFHGAQFEPATYHYVELEGEQISVDDENEITDTALNSPLAFTTNGPTSTSIYCPETSTDPAKNTEGSLYWLSSMTRVTGTGQTPDPDRFAKQPSEDLIAARMTLRQGSMATRVLERSRPWHFRVPVDGGPPNPIKHTQALAEEVEWNFKARGVPFILNLNSFDGSEGRRLAFVPDRAKKSLLIIIGNTVHGDTGPIPSTAIEPEDIHYSVYHLFVKTNTHGDGPIPHLATDSSFAPCTVVVPATLKPATSTMSTAAATGTGSTHPLVSHAHAIGVSGQPAPSGLNCSPNLWP